MSTLTNLHSFIPFDSKTSKPLTGQRLVRILYKTSRGGKAVANAKASACVSVPILGEISDMQLNLLVPHIQNLLESAQDGICKQRYAANAVSVFDSEINVDACIQYLDDDASGNRLTKEIVAAWFDEALLELCTVSFAEKFFGKHESYTEEQDKRVTQTCNVYRDKISALAGGKTMYSVANCESLLKVLELASDDDVMAIRFSKRLNKMIAEQQDTLDSL